MGEVWTLVRVVGVILTVVVFLAVSRTGCLVLLANVQVPLVTDANCGEGHWLALNASTITCWSGRATGISVVSPGINIMLFFMLMSGGFGVLCLCTGARQLRPAGLSPECVGVVCLGARQLRPADVSPGYSGVVGGCDVGVCKPQQCRPVLVDICNTGSMASFLVLGTIQVLPNKLMMLLLKSCLMLLSFRKLVPPIAVQCRCCVTKALNLIGWSFLENITSISPQDFRGVKPSPK